MLVSSSDREKAEELAAEIGRALSASGSKSPGGKGVRLSGPAPAPLERLQGKWRFQILVRAAERSVVLSMLGEAIPERPPSGTQIGVDVDPQDLM